MTLQTRLFNESVTGYVNIDGVALPCKFSALDDGTIKASIQEPTHNHEQMVSLKDLANKVPFSHEAHRQKVIRFFTVQ